jgi:hypothetical protein
LDNGWLTNLLDGERQFIAGDFRASSSSRVEGLRVKRGQAVRSIEAVVWFGSWSIHTQKCRAIKRLPAIDKQAIHRR